MSVFRRRKSTSKLRNGVDAGPRLPSSLLGNNAAPTRRAASGPPAPTAPPGASLGPQSVRIDDFGRLIPDRPAFAAETAPRREADPANLELLYGYGPIGTTVELSVSKVEKIVEACAREIRSRGLDTPLVLSTMALDLAVDSVNSLIKAYLADPTSLSGLHLAEPIAIAAFLKWSLARLVNEEGGRGFVSTKAYDIFRKAEKDGGFQANACFALFLSRLSPANGRLLTTLLSLFSSVSAHSAKNGLPPRKLAALFSPYIFGLRDDRNFDDTYAEWRRATDALEHVLLSYIRYQETTGSIPTFLRTFIAGYPNMMHADEDVAAASSMGRNEETTRVRRCTRFHTRNLIRQAGSWTVPNSQDWQLLFAESASSSPKQPVYTPSYRHLLNIRAAHGLEDDEDDELQRYGSMVQKDWAKFGESGFQDVDSKKLEFDLTEGDREKARRKRDTLDWSTFETAGFAGREVFGSDDLVFHQNIGQRVTTWPSSQKDITQRLRDAERSLPPFPYDTTPHEEGRIAIDALFFEAWADVLVGGGWARDELKEHSFALIQWKTRPRTGWQAAPYPPREDDPRTEERWFLVEEFVPTEYRQALLVDPVLAKKTSKRSSFLRSVRRRSGGGHTKDAPLPPIPASPPASPPSARPARPYAAASSAPNSRAPTRTLKPIDEAVFSPDNTETQVLSLSNLTLSHAGPSPASAPRPSTSTVPSVYTTPSEAGAANGRAPSTAYAPSVVSTVRATHGHPGESTTTLLPDGVAIAPAITTVEVPLPSQSLDLPKGTASKPGLPPAVGHTKGLDRKGLMARIGTARKVSSEKITKFFAAAKPEPPLSSSSSSDNKGGLFSDLKPGMPLLAPVADAPALTPEASRPPANLAPTGADTTSPPRSAPGTPSLEAAAEVDGEANPYDGLTSPSEDAYGENAREHVVADADEPVRRSAPPRTERMQSAVSAQSSRVANIIGLYEERDRKVVDEAA